MAAATATGRSAPQFGLQILFTFVSSLKCSLIWVSVAKAKLRYRGAANAPRPLMTEHGRLPVEGHIG